MTVHADSAVSTSPFQEFFRSESATGAVLVVGACVALAAANSPWSDAYQRLWSIPIVVGGVGYELALSLRQWINDGLMAVFFLLVGLEIKREMVVGELASARQASLPIAGAIGGMLVPASLYWLTNSGGSEARGWAIPMATDIAFALGALALVAPRLPSGVKVFLAALAIVDDMGAVLVIALFYTHDIAWSHLGVAGIIFAILLALNVLRVRRLTPYVLLGVALWFFVHASGVHATIAGVLLAFTIPSKTRTEGTAPLLKLEHALHGFSAFVVMPLFALSNAGVGLTGSSGGRVTLAVMCGLVVGKPLGITAGAFVAVRLGLARLPNDVNWTMLHGSAWLGGIGFTMSLFIATLAFGGTSLLDAAKLGILGGSLLSGFVGAMVLRHGTRASKGV